MDTEMLRLVAAFTWLLGALAHGLAAAGTALIAKALCPKAWRKVKPWSCSLCMSVWSALAVWFALALIDGSEPMAFTHFIVFGLRYLGAVATSVFLIERTHLFAPPLPDGLLIGVEPPKQS